MSGNQSNITGYCENCKIYICSGCNKTFSCGDAMDYHWTVDHCEFSTPHPPHQCYNS